MKPRVAVALWLGSFVIGLALWLPNYFDVHSQLNEISNNEQSRTHYDQEYQRVYESALAQLKAKEEQRRQEAQELRDRYDQEYRRIEATTPRDEASPAGNRILPSFSHFLEISSKALVNLGLNEIPPNPKSLDKSSLLSYADSPEVLAVDEAHQAALSAIGSDKAPPETNQLEALRVKATHNRATIFRWGYTGAIAWLGLCVILWGLIDGEHTGRPADGSRTATHN